MDSIHPDPTPPLPPSLSEIRAQVARLEASHRSKGLPLSGRIIHVCHHLPIEIIRVVPPSAIEIGGILSPPMTPEFKPEDADPHTESHDAKWRIHARKAHTAMVSGMKSLSGTHEQLVVAWTGEILLQTQSQPTPILRTSTTLPSISAQLEPQAPPPPPEEKPYMVFGGEFTDDEKGELSAELAKYSEVEAEADQGGKLTYVPLYLPPDLSKGHYEGFCKKSKSPRDHADPSTLAAIPLSPLARLHGHRPIPRPPLAPLPPSKYPLCR